MEYWMPVDWYNGGMEHTTLHLLYSRFWHKFLFDCGIVNTPEPYAKRTSHGMILGENNEKMSKSRGNVVNPDEIVNEFGADSLRMCEMFIGDFEKEISDIGIVSYQTNYIYTGSENGMIRFDDLIRDKVEVTIDVDGKLTRFDIDYFEMGDYYFTDLNSILAKTLVKNDDSTDNREQIRFKIDE